MFFCPDCDNAFDITRLATQQGGADETAIPTTFPKKKEDKGDKYEIIINKILEGQTNSTDFANLDPQSILHSEAFKKLKSKQREYVYNKIQDAMPKQQKVTRLENESKKVNLDDNLAYFICKNCGLTKKIQPKTLIFTRTSEDIAQSYVSGNYDDMLDSDILPHTRKYICPNKECSSHTNPEKRGKPCFSD